MRLNELRPDRGATRRRKRRGCGVGSGHGKTSCRGHKGAGQHSAPRHDARFEGGQMPFYRRIPKRGFVSVAHATFAVVNLDDIARLETDNIDVALLVAKGLCRKGAPVKVLGRGKLDRAVTVAANAFSQSARQEIERAGGTARVVS
ncbi:MAG: 50S ribosomal protein L15 [candidate division WOR-3 bacterium]